MVDGGALRRRPRPCLVGERPPPAPGVAEAELGEHIADVRLRALGDDEPLADVLVRQPPRHETEDLELPRGDPGHQERLTGGDDADRGPRAPPEPAAHPPRAAPRGAAASQRGPGGRWPRPGQGRPPRPRAPGRGAAGPPGPPGPGSSRRWSSGTRRGSSRAIRVRSAAATSAACSSISRSSWAARSSAASARSARSRHCRPTAHGSTRSTDAAAPSLGTAPTRVMLPSQGRARRTRTRAPRRARADGATCSAAR